eukprot:gene23777-9336_t
MAPKTSAGKKGADKSAPVLSILEQTFPTFSEAVIATDKEPSDKYEDVSGLVLTPETEPFLDTWKRPEELVLNNPNIPMVNMVAPGPADVKDAKGVGKGAPAPPVRDFDGKLFSGHKSFEWMYSVFISILSARHTLPPGDFLWELIFPKEKDGSLIKSPSGRYKVRLFIMDAWRTVTVDDRIPVDLFGQFLVVGTRPLQLWPLLLSKALLKVIAAQRILPLALPHQSAIFQMLTGWPAEDLLDPLSGTQLNGGFMFDRLEDAARKLVDIKHGDRSAVATACIIKRALPERPPPRIIVLSGPSAVGRSKLVAKVLEEFPDKFGLTVSHTSRIPHEHESDGKDYYFVDKAKFKAELNDGKFLEHAVVRTHKGSYMYGSSYDTVREVAATGRVCLMSLDAQGVRQLQANKRIDGLYLFITPPTTEELEQRMRGRLIEHDMTVAKRLLWARSEMEVAEKTELYEHLVQDTEYDEVYLALKEAISTLSPIIRNRLRGLPAYVLDYSDLIPPNLVEKPFLKPVIISGPSIWERKEFPDVFAIPVKTTTRPADEEGLFRVTIEEEAEMNGEGSAAAAGSSTAIPATNSVAEGLPGSTPPASTSDMAAETGGDKAEPEAESIFPDDIHVTEAEFDALRQKETNDPSWLVVSATDNFLHKRMTHRTGVIKSGRLPLLDFESDCVSQLKDHKIDYLSIFITPTSLEDYNMRLSKWLTESDEDIDERMSMAQAQLELAESGKVYDNVLMNDSVDDCYNQIKGLISRYRPDIIMPEADRLAAEAEAAAAMDEGNGRKPILALFGPDSAGREVLTAALAESFPDKFAVPALITDRKPAKGEVSTDVLRFVAAKDFVKMAGEGGLVYQRPCEGGNLAVTVADVKEITSKGMVAVLDMGLPDASIVLGLQSSASTKGCIISFVSSATILGDAEAAEHAAKDAAAGERYDFILTVSSKSDLVFAMKVALSSLLPDLISPPFRPIVVAGPFGTGKRVLLQRLFEEAKGKFAVPPVLSTRGPDPSGAEQRAEMVVITLEQAAELVTSNNFLIYGSALNHSYGVTYAGVKEVLASGKVCVVECDHVKDMQKMRAAGFDALYIYMGVDDDAELATRIDAEIRGNPPLGYEVDEACSLFLDQARADIQAARSATWTPPPAPPSSEQGGGAGNGEAEGDSAAAPPAEPAPVPLVDEWIDNGSDSEAAFTCLSEALHKHFPEVIPLNFVWGYGRSLWDTPTREYGRHTLKGMVLGPAGVGKTTVCEHLSKRYKVPHINVGDLIYDEVKRKTPLGLEAKVFMDASKTVPDHFFITLLAQHLQSRECQIYGWLLDGFPHTWEQAQTLQELGIIPDKVILMDAPHNLLLDRTVWRRMDYDTGRTYHLPEVGSNAMSEPIKPLDKDGNVDMEIVARVFPRHDDSMENVKARLALSDMHMPALRASFQDVSLRMSGVGKVDDAVSSIADFFEMESTITDIDVVESTSLKETQYQRRQLLRLQQDDRKTFWVDLKELSKNAHCLQIARNIAQFTESHKLRRADLKALSKQALFMVDSPEPSSILVSFSLGMQYPLDDNPTMGRNILLVSGPAASGKTTAIQTLLKDYPKKVVAVTAVSTRQRFKGETENSPFCFVDDEALAHEQGLGGLVGVATHDGASYAVRLKELESAWEAGLLPVVEAPLEVCTALKVAQSGEGAVQAPILTNCVYLSADVATLDVRMRNVAKLEEVRIQAELEMAVAEMAVVAESLAGAPLVDLSLSSLLSPLRVYHSIKDVASKLWKRSRPAMPCQVLLEEFSWKSDRPGKTLQRLRTIMANAGTLELPRGRHLLRVVASAEYLHSVWFLSNSKCIADDYIKVLPEYESDSALMATTYDGDTGPVSPGAAALHFRYNLKVAEKMTLAAYLSVAEDEQLACSELVLVNNATKTETIQPMSRLAAMEIEPNGDAGYCLLSLAKVSAKRKESLPDASWALTLTASSTPPSFEPVSVARSQVLVGQYEPNSKLVLSRCLIVPMSPVQMALVATTDPPVPFKLKVLQAVTGQEVQWNTEYPSVLEQHAPDGSATVHNATLPAGKYVLHLELDNSCCEAGLQPQAVTGEVEKGPISWRVVFLPSVDEKVCPILADDSRQRHLKTMMDAWSSAAAAKSATVAKGAAAAGGKAAAPPKGGPPGLSARAQAAAALLEKFQEEISSSSQGSSAPPPPVRTLKDGSMLTLAPGSRLATKFVSEEEESRVVVTEELEVRQAALKEASIRGQEVVASISSGLESHKTERSALAARKASELAEWRSKKLTTAKDIRQQRAEAIALAKRAEASTRV